MIVRINQSVNALQTDKIMHFTAGVGIYAVLVIIEELNLYQFENKLMLVGLIGLSKEIHDSFYSRHTACKWDIIAVLTGGYVVKSIYKW